nr:hypothetical protein GCM10020092_071610 [Actinoplanes digitatis]
MRRLTWGNALRWCLVLALLAGGGAAMARWGGWLAEPAQAATGPVTDDAGDELATTTFDGPMVRKRAAVAIHPAKGADRGQIARELRAAAQRAKLGTLTDATFAVFSPEMLEYLVPEQTLVLDEGVSVPDAEAFMRDNQPASVAFYLVQPVLVHDLTFAVVPAVGVLLSRRRDGDRPGGRAVRLAQPLPHHGAALRADRPVLRRDHQRRPGRGRTPGAGARRPRAEPTGWRSRRTCPVRAWICRTASPT